MKNRKIVYIDVADMSEKELCETLGIKYTPWYKSSFFWGLAMIFAGPFLLYIGSVLQ
jgi:hypothetical protein